ncbi:NAD(P)H-binding protein [Mucilaginibacter sp.]|uniref:NmrA family NAD(P)-binding protein n=1 Tax=Mucilaginibacter sp. TaxID=1882438 RepID=UPI003B002EED
MKIALTGSLGNIGKPLTEILVKKKHDVTVISNNAERQKEIENLGAKAAIGSIEDVDFLTKTFRNADVVFCMEAVATAEMFNPDFDIVAAYIHIAEKFVQAINKAGVKKVVHLSSIGAHAQKGFGLMKMHHEAEKVMQTLPEDVGVKIMRPVGFFSNLYRSMQSIKMQGAIISNYGGDKKEPWVSPKDIAATIAKEMELPFNGKSIRYIASEELSPNEVAKILGDAIGKPELKWLCIPDEQLLQGMLSIGMNKAVAEGFIEMQAKQRTGEIFEDYNKHTPEFGEVKLSDFAKEFAAAYNQ